MRSKARNLTEGNIQKQLISLTWPMLFGMLGMIIFNLVDTYFVGKLGVQQLAAISFTFPVVMFINSLSRSIGIGTSSLISRNIIIKNREDVRKMASRSILLGIIIVIVFVSIGLMTMRFIFTALGAENLILKYVLDYMSIWYIGVPFVVIPVIGNNIVRATGDTLFPGILMALSATVNIILDPVLIFGLGPFPELGIKGAAAGTVIARSTGLIFILFVLIRRERLITARLGSLGDILSTWKDVLYIAGPASLALLITPISLGIITRIVSGFGEEVVAAFGVASKVEMFAMMVIASLGTVMIIYIGQNISRNKFYRILKTLHYAFRFSMIWGIFLFIAFLLAGDVIAGIFSNNRLVVDTAKKYFYIVGASYGFQGLVVLSTASFNGMNRPYPSAVFSILRMLVIYVPLAWAGSIIFDIYGVFYAALIANILVGTISYLFLKTTIKGIRSNRLQV